MMKGFGFGGMEIIYNWPESPSLRIPSVWVLALKIRVTESFAENLLIQILIYIYISLSFCLSEWLSEREMDNTATTS